MACWRQTEANEEWEPAGDRTEVAGVPSLCTAGRENSERAVRSSDMEVKVVSTDIEVNVLSTEIDKSILRGVSSHVLLRRCGAAFRGHEFDPANNELSFEARHLDDFVSHDWASSAAGKVFALCLVYNGLAAAAVSLAVGVLLAVAESHYVGLLPSPQPGPIPPGGEGLLYGYWCQSLCPLVYVLFFFIWQDVRVALRLGTRKAFLDKYCIDQADVERKAVGILGLGGFLRHTDRLIICWTPRYFTRLWCTYEVATWLFLEKPLSSVLFMPLSHAQSIGVCFVGVTGVCVLFMCASVFFYDSSILVLGVVTIMVWPVATHFWRRLTREILDLPRQLEEFSITRAACFCCSNGHQAPNDPEVEIPCDRRLVYQTVAHWFPTDTQESGPSKTEPGASELEGFDSAVRGLLGPWVLKHAGPAGVRYKYIVLMSMPFAFRMLDAASSVGRNSNAYLLKRLVGVYPAIILAMIPVMYKLSLRLVCFFETSVGILAKRHLDVAATLCLAALLILLCAALWLPLNVAVDMFDGSLPTVVVAVLLFVLAGLVFADELMDIQPARLRRCRRRVPSRTSTRQALWRACSDGTCGTVSSQGSLN